MMRNQVEKLSSFTEPVSKVRMDMLHAGRFKINSATAVYSWRLGPLLIDSCSPSSWTESKKCSFKNFLNYNSKGDIFRTNRAMVLSHAHEDHAGCAQQVQKFFSGQGKQFPIYYDGIFPKMWGVEFYRRLVWGSMPKEAPKTLPLPAAFRVPTDSQSPHEIELLSSVDIDELNALPKPSKLLEFVTLVPIHSPGHERDHYTFWIPEMKWLISSDSYINTRTTISFRRGNWENIAVLTQSLGNLQKYDFDTVFCSHRGVVHGGKEKLRQKYELLVELKQKVDAVMEKDSSKSLRWLTRKFLGSEGIMYYFTFNGFSKINLMKGLVYDTVPEELKTK